MQQQKKTFYNNTQWTVMTVKITAIKKKLQIYLVYTSSVKILFFHLVSFHRAFQAQNEAEVVS